MSQQSIDSYLRQRKETIKRKAGSDDLTTVSNSKVLVLEQNETVECTKVSDLITPNGTTTHKTVKLISNKKDNIIDKLSEGRIAKPKGKAVIKLSFDNVKACTANGDISKPANILEANNTREHAKNCNGANSKTVIFAKRGVLSPKKNNKTKNSDIMSYMMKRDDASTSAEDTKAPSVKETNLEPRKELSLGDIKKCISRSSRINELRSTMSRLNKGFDKLNELDKITKTSDPSTLKEFRSIDLLIPASPVKQSPCKAPPSPLTSPVKELLMSPRKAGLSPIKSPIKVPAYERYSSLTTPTPSLTLPHHYRWVGEVFKAVEQASSLLFNRKETVTFSKVRQAAQEMLRRNVTEKHIAQIKHISPRMYTFSREKVKNFGGTSKKEEYELVLLPKVVKQVTGSPSDAMTPAIVLNRQRAFYNLLLEKVKDHHSVFLTSLDPPLEIRRTQLKRWHPEFEIERIPDIEEDPLPEPPNVERFSTAQDVLTHFREKFNCNTKMERALAKLAEAKERGLTAEEQKVTGLNADGSEQSAQPIDSSQSNVPESNTSSAPLLNPALKGIPKALLEKVRARQAAKALESMTRSPAQEKDALSYQRLPDLARLLRNLFVTEKKSVLSFECIVSKLSNSFRIKISSDDLIKHIRLLAKELPRWLTFYEFRKKEFLKMVKDEDMSKIMKHLGDLATKYSLN